MADEPTKSQPLEYMPHWTRRPLGRGGLVTVLGAAVALAGVGLFVFAHDLTETNDLVAEHRRQHELLWAAFGIALLLCGTAIAAVGLKVWCGADAD